MSKLCHWDIPSTDIASSVEFYGELGGRVVEPKSEIGEGMGWMAAFEDPCGGHMGLWQEG